MSTGMFGLEIELPRMAGFRRVWAHESDIERLGRLS